MNLTWISREINGEREKKELREFYRLMNKKTKKLLNVKSTTSKL